MRWFYSLLILGLLIFPDIAYGADNGVYDIDRSDYAGTALKDVPATVQLKTPGGSSKYVLPSDIVGSFHQAYIHVGRTLNATNYLTVTFGDGATITYKDDTWATQGMVTIPDSAFAAHPSRGITVSFTHSGAYAENLYLKGYWIMGNQVGSTPTPSATVRPSATPSPTVNPSPTPVATTNPNPTASATASPNPNTGGDTGGDPGYPIECTAACQTLIDQLDCPNFDEYLGKWAEMIKGTYPPPPNWNNVAAIMRDTIVPAMGQEIVNRSPEIAKIIADEFERRETPVNPPPVIPSYDPVVPRFTDTPSVTGNLNSNVPDFTPDYSESKPFVIPDPLNVDLTDNSDKGYKNIEPNNTSPDYHQTEVEGEPTPHYIQKLTWHEENKEYQVENIIVADPSKNYNYQSPTGSTAPDYQSSAGTPDNANYNYNEDNQVPIYKGGE